MTNHISRTAYYTLGLRAQDAAKPKPLCGDYLAQQLMNDEARQVWQEFENFPRPNASNAMRHAIIDEHLRSVLADNPTAKIIIIGAGFDTRAFRLKGGRWIEVDEPAIINIKEETLPSNTAPNPVERLSINFAKESLQEKLQSHASTDLTYIVIEGVFMYLTHQQRRQLLQTLQALFPRHIVYCDLMRKRFFERYSREIHERIAALGTQFTDLTDSPEDLFRAAGYRTLSRTSIPLQAAQRGGVDIPPLLIRWFLSTLRNGYCVWQFRFFGERIPSKV
jgi:methyltransferase (TIGR00027 family)